MNRRYLMRVLAGAPLASWFGLNSTTAWSEGLSASTSALAPPSSMSLRCWFDAVKCKRGIEALRLYRSEWDDEKGKSIGRERIGPRGHAA